jgi:hypothetical protein
VATELRPLPRTNPRWRRVVAVGCTIVAAAALLVAWQQPGFPDVPPLPIDKSVWIVNDDRLLVGRVNTDIGELDSAAPLRGVSDVLQDPIEQTAGTVLVVDQNKHELQVLDTATVTFGARVAIPDDAAVDLRGGTLAVADRMDGRMWVGESGTVSSVDARLIEPKATVGALPVLAVSTKGSVFATAPGSGELHTWVGGADPTVTTFPQGPLSLSGAAGSVAVGADSGGDLQLTAVGEEPVVLDRADDSLRVQDRRIMLPPMTGAVLQQPGPASTEVLIASTQGLYAITLADGTVRTVAEVAGTPTSPAVNGGCIFDVWSPADHGANTTAVSACATDPADPNQQAPDGQAPVRLTPLDGATGSETLSFRQRGSAVVLGDSATGTSWVATDGYRKVNNWADVAPLETATDDSATVDDPTQKDDLPRLPPDCTAVPIGVPTAADDEFGVRAGRATVLRVLDNDPSVDCTSVVIDSVTPLPEAVGSVAIVAGGSAVQVTVPATATGKLPPIEYQVGNGRGGTATARVLVTVLSAEVTIPPEMVRRSAVTTEVNGTISYNVLDDYRSPTGDDLFLTSATGDSTDVVSFRPDGSITYRNTGSGAGTEAAVDFVVSDGVKQTEGRLTVAIAPADSTTPVVYPSFTTAVIGSEAIVNPLRKVVSAAVQPATISTVRPEPGSEAATGRLDPLTGAVAVTATAPGSYYLTFEVSTGGRGVTGVLRADFVEATESTRSVVPMTDIAYLTPGGQTVVDPLANDTDPDGQGLAVRQVDLPSGSPITAAVVDLHLVRVSAPRVPGGTVVFGYSVFDGADTKVGQIRIVPVPAPKRIPPPLAAPITATVRAGDAVTIPVTRFATSQDGSPVTAELDAAQVATLPGRAFSTGDSIRYLAPPDSAPGTVSFSYTAVAGSSTPLQPVQTVSTVTITVVAGDPARNSAPNTPPTATARVFTNGSISISVPLAGTDPDGDWVVLQSLEQPEAPLGDTAVSESDTLSYKAFGEPGVDRIRYLATDPAGLTVSGSIIVLVVEPGASARPPVAPDLTVAVRPGASIRIDPLSVVVDPGGQQVLLANPAFVAPPELTVVVDDQGLILTAPATETVASMRYTVVNAKGLTASGSVKVTVSADAPVPAPTAKDVFVRPADLAANNRTVDVDVSGSITNRSGRRDQLTVSVDPLSTGQASKIASQAIRVTVTASRQIVAYQVTDTYGSSVSAFIVVPPQQQLVGPQVIAGMGPIPVDAGKSADVLISDYVTVGGGGAPSIAPAPALRSTQGTAVRNSATSLTLSTPTSAGGAAARYVPIQDGAGAVVVLTLAVQIEPRVVPPPQLDSTELQVEVGTSASVDLRSLTSTADDEQQKSISYAVGPGPDGIAVNREGSVVAVSVRPDVPRGTTVDLPIQAVDGEGRDGKAVLTVSVTGSRQPLATVVDQQIAQGRAGVEVAADLLTGSFDPIGLGLTVTKVSVTEGVGGVAAGPVLTGSTVRLTPAVGFVGDIVVAAEITDGTKDPERVVTANLRVSIQDRPSAPGTPALIDGTLTAGSVQLAWSPADANGAAIDAYTVAGSGIRQDCAGSETSCVIGGLTAGQPYVFVVTARNSVGESSPSAPSAVIVPDAVPTVPGAPTADYLGRGQLRVSWQVPTGAFTPVTGIAVQIVRNGQVDAVRDNVSSPLVLTDLDPGGAYQFQVRASNAQGTSDWSAPSSAVVPSGVPGAPTALTATFVYDAGRRGIEISWSPPADTGGEAVQGYRLILNNVEVASGGSDFLSRFVPTSSNDSADVVVIARNGRGEGPPAGPVRVDSFSRPSGVTLQQPEPLDSALRLSWSAADAQGSAIDHYDYQIDDGGWVSTGSAATSTTIGSLTNGRTYKVEIRGCNGRSEPAYADVRCGAPSNSVSGRPFGPPSSPQVTIKPSAEWGQTVTASWVFPESGNGREITSRTVTVSGAVEQQLDSSLGSWVSPNIGFGKSLKITVSYCVSGPSECTADVTDTAKTASPTALNTVAVGTLPGTCGLSDQSGADWPTDAAGCAGLWVPVGGSIDVLCVAVGTEYPVPTTVPTTDKRWYLATDNAWYRFPAFATTNRVPNC